MSKKRTARKPPHRDYQGHPPRRPRAAALELAVARDDHMSRAEFYAMDHAFYAGLADHLAATLDTLPRERWADSIAAAMADDACPPECPICSRIGRPEERALFGSLFYGDDL